VTCRKRKGFTLLETLVALCIVAVGLAAGVRAAALSTESAQRIRSATHALWVAQNTLAVRRAGGQMEEGGEMTMGGIKYHWQAASTPAGVWSIQVYDSPSGGRLLARLGAEAKQ